MRRFLIVEGQLSDGRLATAESTTSAETMITQQVIAEGVGAQRDVRVVEASPTGLQDRAFRPGSTRGMPPPPLSTNDTSL